MKGKRIGLMAVCAVLAAWGATVGAGPPPPTLWAQQIGSSDTDSSRGVAVDASGNIYITGNTRGDLGGPNQGDHDAFIVKYSSGGTVQWTRKIGTSRYDYANGIAADSSGNIYIAGATRGDIGGSNQGEIDAFLVRYNSSGTVQWTRQIGTSGKDYAYAIAVDGSGNSYITGGTWGGLGRPNPGGLDAFIVKYDSGGAVQWSRQIGSAGHDLTSSIAVDASGNSYIAGYTEGNLGGPNQGGSDAFIVKYNSAGTVQWMRQIGSSGTDDAEGITVDGSGNIYITGRTYGDLAGPNQGAGDAFIVKYDSGGTLQWIRQMGTANSDLVSDIAVDGSGNSYITGYTYGDLGGPSHGDWDAFIVTYDSGGTVQWSRQIGTGESDFAYGIAVDGSGNIYITGSTRGDLGGPNQGGNDAFLVAIAPEPATLALLALGGLALIRRRKRHAFV